MKLKRDFGILQKLKLTTHECKTAVYPPKMLNVINLLQDKMIRTKVQRGKQLKNKLRKL